MEPDQVRTSQDLSTLINERDVDHVTVALSDLQGLLRGKYMARDKFLGALDHGSGCHQLFSCSIPPM
jgi:glutamine synthetase